MEKATSTVVKLVFRMIFVRFCAARAAFWRLPLRASAKPSGHRDSVSARAAPPMRQPKASPDSKASVEPAPVMAGSRFALVAAKTAPRLNHPK